MATGYVGQQAFEAALNSVYETGNVKCALLTDAHTPDEDTQQFWSDVSANEATGTGYTAGGAAVTSTVTFNAVGNTHVVNFGGTSWDATGGSLSGGTAVWYDSTGTPSTSRILFQNRFTTQPSTATNDIFTIPAQSMTVDWPNTAD